MSISDFKFTLNHSCKTRAHIHQVHAQAIINGLFIPLLSYILESFTNLKNSPKNNASSNHIIIYITKIFNLLPNPSQFNYNSIIRAYTQLNSPHASLILFLQMRRRPIAPDSHTFAFVLKACGLLRNSHSLAKALHAQVTKFGFLDDVYVHTMLSCTYNRSGDVDGVKGVFEGSSFRDVVSYTTMINVFVKAGEIDRARELFDEMLSSSRDVMTYTTIMDGFVKAGLIDRARELFEEMPSSSRNVVTYNVMVGGFAKAGRLDLAREMFDEMPMLWRNVVNYNTMIHGFCKGGDIDRAKELFDGMPSSLRDAMSYNVMIHGFSKAGQIDRARELFDEMQR